MIARLRNWHSVEDRLPQSGERVLVVRKATFTDGWYIDIAKFDGEKWRCNGAVINVTYWHELPELPQWEDIAYEHKH